MCRLVEELAVEEREKGREESKEEGREEGREETTKNFIKRILLKKEFSFEKIADMLGVSVEEVKKIAESLPV